MSGFKEHKRSWASWREYVRHNNAMPGERGDGWIFLGGFAGLVGAIFLGMEVAHVLLTVFWSRPN